MSKKFVSNRSVKTLYEDEQYIAFFKPAGLLAVPADHGDEPSLTDMVNAEFAARPDHVEGTKLHPCHRIDRETSGVIIFAKGQVARDHLMNLFRAREVKKKYIAFVHGRVLHPRGEMKNRLKEDVASGDKNSVSITRYALKQQFRKFAVVEVIPLTGRTNQIRLHFKEVGNPLVGENKFVFRKDYELKFKRTALHAAELSFIQPFTHDKVKVESELALDMQNFLERNRR
jgi:23S rRNA pseudouridine1911/1915/1917 synthase